MIDVPPSQVVLVIAPSGAWAPLKDSQMRFFASQPQVDELLGLLPANVSGVQVYNGQLSDGYYYGSFGGVQIYFLTHDGPRPYSFEALANLSDGQSPSQVRISEFVGIVLSNRPPGTAHLEVRRTFDPNLGELTWIA